MMSISFRISPFLVAGNSLLLISQKAVDEVNQRESTGQRKPLGVGALWSGLGL